MKPISGQIILEMLQSHKSVKVLYLTLFCLLTFGFAKAQYFYQDIVSAQNTMKEHLQYQKQNVKHIRILSYDDNHNLNKNFHCVKEFSDDYKVTITHTGSFETGNSTVYSFFDNRGRIIHSADSTAKSVNDTYYYYDKDHPDRIDSLRFISSANQNGDTFRYTESHIYEYDSAGRPLKMVRLKNDKKFSIVTFTTDSLGRVIKESEEGSYDTVPPVYYKYNALGLPTDIFHYNFNRQKMIPDFMFDYDDQNRLSEKTTITMNVGGYLLWKFLYGEKGLIDQEKCYEPKGGLLGSLEFEYTYK